jgi:hypothetical protein
MYARVVFCLIILQIYPCNTQIKMGHDIRGTLTDNGIL